MNLLDISASLIIPIVILMISFSIERIWDYYKLKQERSTEYKKLRNERVNKNLTHLEKMEIDLRGIHFILKRTQSIEELKARFKGLNLFYYELMKDPSEYLVSGNLTEFFELIYPKVEEEIITVPDKINIFHDLVKHLMASVNLIRIYLISSFFSSDSLGHISIRSHLYEYLEKHYNEKLTPKEAKKKISREIEYNKINSKLYDNIKELIEKLSFSVLNNTLK